MQFSKVAPPGARVPLLVLAVALAAGAVMFLRVHAHRAAGAAPRPSRSLAAGASTPSARDHAMP